MNVFVCVCVSPTIHPTAKLESIGNEMLGGKFLAVLSFIRFVHFDFECHNRLYSPSYEWWITETNFEANKATKEQWGDGAQVLEQSILNSNDEKYFTSMVFASSDREWDGYYLESELKLRSFMAVRLTKPLKILFLSLCVSPEHTIPLITHTHIGICLASDAIFIFNWSSWC